ncbi:VOC family protein [Flavobacterium fluviatile]|uniref:VOC family protein n=1 Tax=Flavobacterium fluviatile TaxID=1862387 RepID=UPI0013D7942A|nr:VOC family protein [Flavobacterium fluviatile]
MTLNTTISIKPFLTVSDGKRALDFYIAAFGATEKTKYEFSNGKISAELAIENASFFIGDEEPEFGNLSPKIESNSPVRLILTTQNADKLFDQALKFGATTICPMTTEEDWRIGKLIDPFGHIWEIGYVL